MKIDVVRTAAEFEGMSAKELLAEWPRYFDDPPKSRSNKSYLMGELIYRIQELSYGGLTKQTIDRLEALAENKSLKERKGDVSRLSSHIATINERLNHIENQVNNDITGRKKGC